MPVALSHAAGRCFDANLGDPRVRQVTVAFGLHRLQSANIRDHPARAVEEDLKNRSLARAGGGSHGSRLSCVSQAILDPTPQFITVPQSLPACNLFWSSRILPQIQGGQQILEGRIGKHDLPRYIILTLRWQGNARRRICAHQFPADIFLRHYRLMERYMKVNKCKRNPYRTKWNYAFSSARGNSIDTINICATNCKLRSKRIDRQALHSSRASFLTRTNQ